MRGLIDGGGPCDTAGGVRCRRSRRPASTTCRGIARAGRRPRRASPQPFGPDHHETQCGFKVRGATIVDVVIRTRPRVDASTPRAPTSASTRRRRGAPACWSCSTTARHRAPGDSRVPDGADHRGRRARGCRLRAVEQHVALGRVPAARPRSCGRCVALPPRPSRPAGSVSRARARAAVARRMQYAKGIDPRSPSTPPTPITTCRTRAASREMSAYLLDDLGRARSSTSPCSRASCVKQRKSTGRHASCRSCRCSRRAGRCVALDAASRCPAGPGICAPRSATRCGRSSPAPASTCCAPDANPGGADDASAGVRSTAASQEHKDSVALKKEWLEALGRGLAKSGLTLPIPEHESASPTTATRCSTWSRAALDDAGRGGRAWRRADDAEKRFIARCSRRSRRQRGITDGAVAERWPGQDVVQRGPAQLGVGAGRSCRPRPLRALGSGASIALATHDVYQYLKQPGDPRRRSTTAWRRR